MKRFVGRSRRYLAVGLVVVAVSALAGCKVTSPGPGSSPCYVGTWELANVTPSGTVETPIGTFAVVTTGTGGTLTVSGANTWTLAGDATFEVSGSSSYGQVEGTLSATVNASGAYYSSSGSRLNFGISSVSGTATFTGTVNGNAVPPQQLAIDQQLAQQVLGLSGGASYTCGGSPGSLTLEFSNVTLEF